MIKKLMKYDISKMSKILIYIYIISIALGGLTRLINLGSDIQVIAIIGYVFGGLTYSAIGSVIVNTFVHILKVFIGDFYKDESYLTHTLPVSKSKLLLSKYLSSLIVIFASIIVSVISLFLVLYSDSLMQGLRTFIDATVSGFNISVELFLTLIVIILFTQICTIMSMGFAATIQGNRYNSRRVIKGLLCFFVFYFGSMLATLTLATIALAITGNIGDLVATQISQSGFITLIITCIVSYSILSVVFYYIGLKLFKKGVNVD